MSPLSKLTLLSLFILSTTSFLVPPASSQSCSHYKFPSNQTFSSCVDLPYLNFSLHWTRSHSSALCLAFHAPQTETGWIAWGINPNSSSMVGSQALVGFKNSHGKMVAYTSSLASYTPSLEEEKLVFPVYDVSAEYFEGEMIVFATLGVLGGGGGVAGAKFNHVWQEGSRVVNGVPSMHPIVGDNVLSKGTIEFH